MSDKLPVASITVSELAAKMAGGERIDLIDVRTPAEFTEIHAEPAKLLPLDKLTAESVKQVLTKNDNAPIYVICKSGGRGRQACEKLQSAGLNVVNVDGGTTAWAAAGLAVIRGRKTISLERQVRIVAGTLVFAGTLLGAFVNPLVLIIPGFVGAGLVFAGVTDTCGMAIMLAKMPWNQRGGGATCSV
ncbi:MAG: rhodanese-like domain-containing protein [Planctomycetota bacterium]